jgi:hypothetical protein
LLTNGTAGAAHPGADALAAGLQGNGSLPAQTGPDVVPEGIFPFSIAVLGLIVRLRCCLFSACVAWVVPSCPRCLGACGTR